MENLIFNLICLYIVPLTISVLSTVYYNRCVSCDSEYFMRKDTAITMFALSLIPVANIATFLIYVFSFVCLFFDYVTQKLFR